MNIRAVIFDLYGTLLDVGPAPPDGDARWRCLCHDWLHVEPRWGRLDFSVECETVTRRRHKTAQAQGISWPEIEWPSVVVEVLPELAQLASPDREEFIFRQIQTGHTTVMRAETAAALVWLKKSVGLLGIASNAQSYTVRELQESLAAQALRMDLFENDLCFWSYTHGFSKPDPHVFQILTARLAARGISPSEILMVGDRLDNDIRPAQAHGWQTWQLDLSANRDWAALRATLGSEAKVLS
jgi:FMN phosphatase YigB (HAD superfamily)